MKLAIVAGEASGDLHAAGVVRELEKLDPSLVTFGIGGDLLERAGTRLSHHAREMAIMGLFNVVRHLGTFRRIMRDLVDAIAAEKPDAVLLVDYPEFNLRVAKHCRRMGIPVVYYISPQIWAWRRGRVRQIAENVDRMIVLFPFEEEFYREHGVATSYHGHPLIDHFVGVGRPGKTDGGTRIALLPGSRRMEVSTLLPAMLDAVAILRREREVEAYVIQAPTIDRDELQAIVETRQVDVPIRPHDRGQSVASADIAFSSSGTATLECAVLGTPVIVMYRLTRANYWLAQRLVKLQNFSLVNIVAGKDVVPELLQHEVTGERIAQEARRMLEPATYESIRRELARVREKLGEPGASARVAEEVYRLVKGTGA